VISVTIAITNDWTVPAGSSQTLTAEVQNDTAQAGVTWTISPESGAGALRDATGSSVTYVAPPSPPPVDVRVTITAKAVADEGSTASGVITVPAVRVSLAPQSALMPTMSSQSFVAAARYDPQNRGVAWTLTQEATSCSPGCGSLAEIDSVSAAFTAPAVLPATRSAKLTATSISDATKSASATIVFSTGTVQIAPAVLNFGEVKVNSSQRVRATQLTNRANTVLEINGISITGKHPDDFLIIAGCDSSIAAGDSCQIEVAFKPQKTGTRSAMLSIADSSSDSPQRIDLSGTGCSPICPHTAAISSAMKGIVSVTAPGPTGSQQVGTQTLEMVDADHEDRYLGDGRKRELLVRFWYPAVDRNPCKPAPYAAPEVVGYFAKLLQIPAPDVKTNSCLDAHILDGAFPVVVFTHGYTGAFTDYTYLFEDLASRGYIVASIGHTYESTVVAFPDGRIARSLLGSFMNNARMDLPALSFAKSIRLTDVGYVIDELARLNAQSDGPFAGHLDISSIAIAGHSLGGLTALETIERDSRIRAAVILDGVMTDDEVALINTPLLLVDADREIWSPDERRLWQRLRGPRFAVNLGGAEHVALSDLVWLAKGAIITGGMTTEQIVAATRSYVAAFLDANLQGKPVERLLTGPSEQFPLVEVSGPTSD
jgi:dienelactone hydrolase